MKRFLATIALLFTSLPIFANNLFIWPTKQEALALKNGNENTVKIEAKFLQGQFFKFNRTYFDNLTVGDTFDLNLPNEPLTKAVINKIENAGNTKQIFAYSKHQQESLPVVITLGPKQFFMRIISAEEAYTAQGNSDSGSLLRESQLIENQHKQVNDVKMPPLDLQKIKNTNKKPMSLQSNNNTDIAPIKVLFVHGLTQSQIDENYAGDINTQIQHIVAVTNQIYQDSDVAIAIEATSIVGVDYPIENDASTALDDITYVQHPAFENIADLRYQQGADMVVLLRMFVEGDDACGLAWANSSISSSANFMYSHTSIDCADYVNAHELGHNMGLAHSLAQGDTGYTFPFARGYRIEDENNGFSTVMAYSVTNAPKIYKFSNPDILCTELACGIDRTDTNNGADASYALNQVRFQVSELFDDLVNDTLISSAIIDIADNNLRQCIEQTANALNIQYIGQLKALYCNQANISNLQGLNQFTSLTRLDINGNNINRFDDINQLTKLTALYANDNPISDFSGLSSLTSINELSVNNTGLKSLSFISALTQLNFLSVSDNQLSDLSDLASLTNLSNFVANNNNIQKITPIAQIAQLETLYLSSNQIADLSPISQLPLLTTLYINNNNLTQLQPIAGHPSLTLLTANDNAITSISNIGELPKLEFLSLANNDLTALPSVLNLPNLERLNVANNNIDMVSDMSLQARLRELSLSNNPIVELQGENFPKSLTEINLANTQITNLAFIEGLPNIAELNIASTAVNDINQLNQAFNLISLNLTNTNIADISAIFELHNNWSEIDLTGAANVFCWQIDHVIRYFASESTTRPVSCDTSQDNLDYDSDGITNNLELNSSTNPIYHNTRPGQLSFQTNQLNVLEETSQTTLKVIRSGGDLGEISVDIVTEEGSAQAGSDFKPISQQLTFASGVHVQQVTLMLEQDEEADYGKQFTINLRNSIGTTTSPYDSITVTMQDEDSGVFAWQTQSLQVAEEANGFIINIERTGTTSGQAQVNISAINGTATSDSDYQFSAQTLVFNDEETLKQVDVVLVNDMIAEENESFYLELNGAVNAAIEQSKRLATIEITDNDSPPSGVLSFKQNTISVSESSGNVTIDVIREDGEFGTLTIDYQFSEGSAIEGSDFSASNGTLTFANGETNKSITLNIVDDSAVEHSESFTLQLITSNSEILGTHPAIEITINDNDTNTTPASNSSSSSGGGALFWLFGVLLLRVFRFNKSGITA